MGKPIMRVLTALVLAVLLGYGTPNAIAAPVLVSLDKPVTGSPYFDSTFMWFPPATEQFPWTNVNDGYYNDTQVNRPNPNGWSYWLTPNGQTGWFIIDLQGLYSVSSFDIQNTHNRDFGNDRSGKDFHISLSTDGIAYTTVLTSTLPDAIGVAYPLPIETYTLDSPTLAQYVMFNLDSYYGGFSGGINELSVYGEPVPVPPSMLLFGSGLLGLAGFRRFMRFRG